jgi:transposase
MTMADHDPLWVGLDVGEETSFLSAIDAVGGVALARSITTEHAAIVAALEELAPRSIERIAVEASAVAVTLVRKLRGAGYTVLVCETRQTSRYLRVRVNKTDGNDAQGLAEIARLGRSKLARVHVKSVEAQHIRSKLVFRHKLNLHRVACEAMIRSLFRLNGGRFRSSARTATFKCNVETALEQTKAELEIDLSEEILPLLSLSLTMRSTLERIEADLAAWAHAHPVCSKFLEIPGVGPICAISFYSAIEDPTRFERASDVGPFLGLTPVVLQSGKSLRHARISRRGNKLTRTHLTLAASIVILRCRPNRLKLWAQAVAERAGKGKAKVALARKLAVLMLAIWKKDERYDPDHKPVTPARVPGPATASE